MRRRWLDGAQQQADHHAEREAADVRDIEAARKLFPKTVALARDNAEKFYATSQELVGLTVKTGEAIGNLVKGSFEAANEGFVKPVAKKAAK